MKKKPTTKPTRSVRALFVEERYAEAFEAIRDAYRKHRKRIAVAEALGVTPWTVSSWINRLVERGLGDPRDGIPVATPGRPETHGRGRRALHDYPSWKRNVRKKLAIG